MTCLVRSRYQQAVLHRVVEAAWMKRAGKYRLPVVVELWRLAPSLVVVVVKVVVKVVVNRCNDLVANAETVVELAVMLVAE